MRVHRRAGENTTESAVVEMTSALIALIGTLFGGAGFKILEHFLTKKQLTDNTATSLRGELRTEIDRREDEVKYYREELAKGEEAFDLLKEKYYAVREENYELKRQLAAAKDELAKREVL